VVVSATVSAIAGKKVVWYDAADCGVRTATAQGGAVGSITLDAGASATDNLYRGLWAWVRAGTGAGQARLISAYVGSTQVATVVPNWVTTPDSTSVFTLLPTAGVDLELIKGADFTPADIPTQTADKILGRNLAGGSDGGRTVQDALRGGRNRVAFDTPITGQFTVYTEDDATPAWVGVYTRGAVGLGPLTVTDPN
jgi:hypothetical protein